MEETHLSQSSQPKDFKDGRFTRIKNAEELAEHCMPGARGNPYF
jgi:hypothetical protein